MGTELISEEYKKLNSELHEENEYYGVSGQRYADQVLKLATIGKCESILDYGCGKATLANVLPQLSITNYDPCIEEYSEPPEPSDLVVCSDVMEHIEPEFVDNVIKDLIRLSNRYLFVQVSTQPALKKLSDGRNAHLVIKPAEWWLSKFMEEYDDKSLRLVTYQRVANHAFIAVFEPWTEKDEAFYAEHDHEAA